MADMNQRHHKLIQDAVANGIKGAVDRLFPHGTTEVSLRKSAVVRELTNELAESISAKLVYTHDKFEKTTFCQQFRGVVNDTVT